jgi:GTP-binding protein
MEIRKAVFVTSAPDSAGLPGDLPEIAVSGKSNVGKSSFINCIAGRNALARVSATPGKTRLLNFFAMNEAFYLVDLPGYGYARASAGDQQRWGRMVEHYLGHSPRLGHVIQLLDIRHSPTADDRLMIRWLLEWGGTFTLVATKCDKLAKAHWNRRMGEIKQDLGLPGHFPMIAFSSEKRVGREQVLDVFESVLEGPVK